MALHLEKYTVRADAAELSFNPTSPACCRRRLRHLSRNLASVLTCPLKQWFL